MAAPKTFSAKCPTCGANLPVPPGVPQLMCRYCQNVITIEHRKAPVEVRPFGAPGAMPSRTLYMDPAAAARASQRVGCIIFVSVLIPVLIPILIGVVPWVARSFKGAVKPFPVTCAVNEEVEVTGNWEGAGPIVTSVGHNCKLHIKNAKLKGTALVKTDASNLQLTLENVTIETTDTMVQSGSNLKVKLTGSTLTSASSIFDSNSTITIDMEGSTVESKAGVAVKAKHGLKLNLDSSKVRGKKAAVDADSSFGLTMKKGSEVTSSEGTAVRATSGFTLEAEGGKIEGPNGALVVSSGANISATGLVLSSKEKAIEATSSLKVDYTDGSITSLTGTAIDGDSSMNLTLLNVKVQGAATAINCESSTKIRASKKTQIIGVTGYGILTSSNTEVTLTDSTIEAGAKAFKGTVNDKLKLTQGARMAGKKGGIEVDGNLDLEGTGGAIDGGSGPGLQAGYNAKIDFRQGVLKGAPAIVLVRKPSSLDLDGTRVEGEQKIPTR